MEKSFEVTKLHVVVKMHFDANSVEMRNACAQIGRLVRYEGPTSRDIEFDIDALSLKQAGEWGITLDELMEKFQAHHDISSFILALWKKPKVRSSPGSYNRWYSHRSPFDEKLGGHFWTKLRLVQTLWILKGFGKEINHIALPRGFQNALKRGLGDWEELVVFAGYDPDSEGLHRKWSIEKIIKDLQKRKERGESINPGSLNNSLYQAIVAHCGSWAKGIKLAGYDPKQERVYKEWWTKESIVQELRTRHAQGLSIDWKTLRAEDPRLLDAMVRHFGSWQRCVLAAGYKPDTNWPGRRAVYGKRYTLEGVLRQILLRHARGDKLTREAIVELDWGLWFSAEEHYGSWDAALQAAGLPPVRRWWSRELVISSLKALHANGEPINPGYLVIHYQGLLSAVYAQFVTWVAAAEAAGFNPDEHAVKPKSLRRE